jgi:hypothetical protein
MNMYKVHTFDLLTQVREVFEVATAEEAINLQYEYNLEKGDNLSAYIVSPE